MKAAYYYTAATKKPLSIKPPPTTTPPPITAGRKYTNCNQDPAKYALALAVEEKLKVIDPPLSAGEIIIPDGTLRDHVRYSMEEAKKRGVSYIIYLKDFARGETKTPTTELDRVYIQQLITLHDLKNGI